MDSSMPLSYGIHPCYPFAYPHRMRGVLFAMLTLQMRQSRQSDVNELNCSDRQMRFEIRSLVPKTSP